MIPRIEEIESAKDKMLNIPVSQREKEFLSDIVGSGGQGKQSWIDFDSYKSLLESKARYEGVSYPEIVRLRRNDIVNALNHAFTSIKAPNTPCETSYALFGMPRDEVLQAIGNYNFRKAAKILERNFNTFML